MTTTAAITETINLTAIPFTEALELREQLFAEIPLTRQLPLTLSSLTTAERESLSHALGIYEEVGTHA